MSNNVENSLLYQEQRTWVVVAYILHFFGILAFPSIIGLILNFLKRDDSLEDLRSHHAWMIRTFFWALFWLFISVITIPLLGLGYLIGVIVWIWWMYRHIRGLVRLADRLPMPLN